MVEEFKTSLADLTSTSKPMIRFLTMLADDYVDNAKEIVSVIETRIMTVSDKLPLLYLIDSVVKSMNNSAYSKLFSTNIVNMFQAVFSKADDKLKQDLFKLRKTWVDVFPENILQSLDKRLNSIDSAWPVLTDPMEEKLKKIQEELAEAKELIKKLRADLAREQSLRAEAKEEKVSAPKRRVLLPTPETKSAAPKRPNEEVVIDDVSYRLPIGHYRYLNIGGLKDVKVECDLKGRILIDGLHVYQIGDVIREVSVRNKKLRVFFHGEFCPLWIDGIFVDARADAPPMEFVINKQKFDLKIDSPTGQIHIDGQVIGVYPSPPQTVRFRDGQHQLRCRDPPKMVIIDGKHHTVVFDEPVPFVFVENRARSVSFSGTSRDLVIDGRAYPLSFDSGSEIEFDGVLRSVQFGGPCHEIVIDKMFFEVGFGEPPKNVNIFGFPHQISISGPTPSIKLGQEIASYTQRFKDGKYKSDLLMMPV